MQSVIGVYDSHHKAVKAVHTLKNEGYPVSRVSILGKTEMIGDHLHVVSNAVVKEAPVSIGVVVGPILGILTGVGVFAIPGLGFLFGAGAIVGAFAGFDLGLVSGGIVSLLATLGMKHDVALKYHEHLKVNHFMVIVQGDDAEVARAKEILEAHGTHVELNSHE